MLRACEVGSLGVFWLHMHKLDRSRKLIAKAHEPIVQALFFAFVVLRNGLGQEPAESLRLSVVVCCELRGLVQGFLLHSGLVDLLAQLGLPKPSSTTPATSGHAPRGCGSRKPSLGGCRPWCTVRRLPFCRQSFPARPLCCPPRPASFISPCNCAASRSSNCVTPGDSFTGPELFHS